MRTFLSLWKKVWVSFLLTITFLFEIKTYFPFFNQRWFCSCRLQTPPLEGAMYSSPEPEISHGNASFQNCASLWGSCVTLQRTDNAVICLLLLFYGRLKEPFTPLPTPPPPPAFAQHKTSSVVKEELNHMTRKRDQSDSKLCSVLLFLIKSTWVLVSA